MNLSIFKAPLALTLALVCALSLTACESDNWGQKQTIGTLGGAAAGGLLGNQFGKGTGNVIATAIGVGVGGWLGNEIGASLDNADRAKLQNAQYSSYNAPVGQTIRWNNPQTGNSGTFTPVRDGTAANGAYCREFQQTVVISGRQQQAYGTACRQPDGSWQIQN
ncbi:MAG: glycine zipper 2TM domain-containing protein [Proteobacteria bacterium]|nr:glycine zipper 2TM domain-containing protein [Pseudomonadota bacterium]